MIRPRAVNPWPLVPRTMSNWCLAIVFVVIAILQWSPYLCVDVYAFSAGRYLHSCLMHSHWQVMVEVVHTSRQYVAGHAD